MPGFANFQIGAARNCAARINQIRRFQNLGTVFALVAASLFITAVRTGSGHITVRQKTLVINRIKLFDGPFFNKAVFIQPVKYMINEFSVLLAAGTAETVERQFKIVISLFVPGMIFVTVSLNAHTLFGRPYFRGRAVLVGAADIQNLVSRHSHKPCINVGRKQTADHMTQMGARPFT